MRRLICVPLILLLAACSQDKSSVLKDDKGSSSQPVDATESTDIKATEIKSESETETDLDGGDKSSQAKTAAITFKKYSCPNAICQPFLVHIDGNELILQAGRDESATSRSVFLNPAKIQELDALIIELRLKTLRTQITPGNQLCLKYESDQPRYLLSLQKGQFPQTLEVYAGCQTSGAVKALIAWFEQLATSKHQAAEF